MVWLAALLVPLLLLKRWLSRHMQGLGFLLTHDPQTAVLLQYLVLLPGIVLHELSHLLAAKLVGVETRGFSLRPTATRGGNVRLGSVIVRESDPLRASWIGLAPLLTGSAAVLFLARRQFGIVQLPAIRPEALLSNLLSYLQAPDAWLWLYLIFAISNAMLPSESDRQPWASLVLFLTLTTGVVYAAGLVPQIPTMLKEWTFAGIRYLVYAFSLTIGVDALFGTLLFVLEKVAESILHRRVEY